MNGGIIDEKMEKELDGSSGACNSMLGHLPELGL
jgi:hypothetical protein